jgi:mannose-6-phosphate isomerase-like protein (cupin superfamily)
MAIALALAAVGAKAEIEVIAIDDQPWYVAEDRAVARELISPRNSSAARMSIAEIIVPEGVIVTPHHHVMEEVYHIVEGEGLVMIEDEVTRVRAGDSVVIAPHQWHNIRNDGEAEIRMLVTCVPAWAPEHLIFDRDAMPADAGASTPDDL